MNSIDIIYNKALQLLKLGHTKEEVLAKLAIDDKSSKELSGLLDISAGLLSMPKNIVPTPLMQRKYAFKPSKRFWLAWLNVSKFAGVSVSLMLLISAFAITGYAASKSAPGKTLFAIKKSEEKIQLLLTSNQSERATLEVAITQNRLSEAQAIFSNPSSNAQQKNAALTELSDQTSSAVAVLNTVATDNPKSDQNHPLINSLDKITKQQQTLLTQITSDTQTQTAAKNAIQALDNNTAQLSQIKESMAIADNSLTLAQLTSNPNSVAVLGQISQISNSSITLEQVTFEINKTTVIQDADGNSLSTDNLKPGIKVNTIGIKKGRILVAQQIILTQDAVAITDNGSSTTPISIQGASLTGTSTNAAATIVITKKSSEASSTNGQFHKIDAEAKANPNSNAAIPPAEDPNAATGSFIFENPQ